MLRIIREEESPRPSTRLSTTEELPSIAACRRVEPRKLSGLVRGELDWIVMKALRRTATAATRRPTAWRPTCGVPGRRAGAGLPAFGVVPLSQVREKEQRTGAGGTAIVFRY